MLVRSAGRAPRAVAMVALLPLMGGCATLGAGVRVADAPHDNCAMHRAAFRSSAPSSDDVAMRAAGAAAVGIAAGLLVGAVTGDARAGLAVGAGVAAVGITATLVDANFRQMEENQRRQALLRHTAAVDRFGSAITGAQLSLDRLTECRRRQLQTLRAEVRSGAVPRAEGERRMTELRGWFDGDVQLVRAFDAQLERESKSIADATRNINGVGISNELAFRPFTGIAAREMEAKASTSLSAAAAGRLRPGQSIRATARDGYWLRVTLPNGRTGFVPANSVAREIPAQEWRGAAEQSLRAAADDESSEFGRVASGSPYRVVGTMPGWVVVSQGSQRSFVRAGALQPGQVDASGRDALAASASVVSARDAFAEGASALESESRRLTLDG
jgi:hypothetical protein